MTGVGEEANARPCPSASTVSLRITGEALVWGTCLTSSRHLDHGSCCNFGTASAVGAAQYTLKYSKERNLSEGHASVGCEFMFCCRTMTCPALAMLSQNARANINQAYLEGRGDVDALIKKYLADTWSLPLRNAARCSKVDASAATEEPKGSCCELCLMPAHRQGHLTSYSFHYHVHVGCSLVL